MFCIFQIQKASKPTELAHDWQPTFQKVNMSTSDFFEMCNNKKSHDEQVNQQQQQQQQQEKDSSKYHVYYSAYLSEWKNYSVLNDIGPIDRFFRQYQPAVSFSNQKKFDPFYHVKYIENKK